MRHKLITIVSIYLLLSCWGEKVGAEYFEWLEPGYVEGVPKEKLEDLGPISDSTVTMDDRGNIFYVTSAYASVVGEAEFFTYEEMEKIEYPAQVVRVDLHGDEATFAEGRFPLKTAIAGLRFDAQAGRLLVAFKGLEISEACDFLSPSVIKVALPFWGSSESVQTPEAKHWEWSGLENCFYEDYRVVEITGFQGENRF